MSTDLLAQGARPGMRSAGRPRALADILRRYPQLRLSIAVALVASVTFTLRTVALGRSYDVFFDEVIYFRIAQNVARTLQVTYAGPVPFLLHPPLFFFLEGAYLKIAHPGG